MRGNILTKLKIKDETALINIFNTISWFDNKRWNVEDNYSDINYIKNDITNCEKILTHWICYITDRQMPFEIIWDKGGYVFSELVYEYSRDNFPPKQILDNHYEKYIDKGKEHFRFKSNDNTHFASRYITNDYQSIFQTLEVFNNSKYKRNIIVYIIDMIRKYENKEDLLVRVACGLHLLTYILENKKANSKRVQERL